MRWTAVVNPAAGRGRTRRLLPALVERLADPAIAAQVRISADLDDLRDRVREALDTGGGVIACGGDGTVAEAAGLVAEAGSVLAVVPSGSGNDFARQLGLEPRHPLDALDAITAGREARVDLGRVNDRWYTTVANTGFDAEANRWANSVTLVGGTPLYILAVLRTLATYRPHRFRVTLDDGDPREVVAWLLAIANTSSYAGGMHIAPTADITDAVLDLTVVGPVTRVDFLRTFPSVFKGTHVRNPLIEQHRARTVTVESLDPSVPMEIYASGERIGPLPARAEVVPNALRVMVPAESPVSRP